MVVKIIKNIFKLLRYLFWYILYIVSLVTFVPLIILVKYIPRTIYRVYKEYSDLGFGGDNIFTYQFRLLLFPKTDYILKFWSIQHYDKPELLNEIIIETFCHFIEKEKALETDIECEEFNKTAMRKLYNRIQRLKRKINNTNIASLEYPKILKEQRKIVKIIMDKKDFLWI